MQDPLESKAVRISSQITLRGLDLAAALLTSLLKLLVVFPAEDVLTRNLLL